MDCQFVPYRLKPASFAPYDPISLQIAAAVVLKLNHKDYEYLHFGSTSFGAGGKGIIDLSLLYQVSKGTEKIDVIRNSIEFLEGHGFSPQHSATPFPITRPRSDIGVSYNDKIYQVHLHVIEKNSKEHQQQLYFKAQMLSDPELLKRYEKVKQSIIKSGLNDQDSYGKSKGYFVKEVLNKAL